MEASLAYRAVALMGEQVIPALRKRLAAV